MSRFIERFKAFIHWLVDDSPWFFFFYLFISLCFGISEFILTVIYFVNMAAQVAWFEAL